MNSSERRMKLILMLQQSAKRLTVNDIAEQFNITPRTVFRDLKALSELNVPVTWDKDEGYSIMHGYKVPPLMFTTRELSTIMIGLNFVKGQIDKTMVEDAEGVELKIKEVLPDDLLNFMGSLKERTVVDPFLHYGPEKIEGGNWYRISNAISQNNPIKFQYRNKGDEETRPRKIDPYLLVFYRDHWNVIGFSHKREAVRNFILDRMSDITILPEAFIPAGPIDAKTLIFRSERETHEIGLTVHSSVVRRLEANLPADITDKTEASSDLFNIRFSFDNLDFINEWLLQFPKTVQILQPDSLIKKRKELLAEMIDDLAHREP
jgi:predicted DNA-binding transcriptional regulator YafY